MKSRKYIAPSMCAINMTTEGLFLGGSTGADVGTSMEIDYNEQVVEGGVNGKKDFDIWEKELGDF